VKYAFISTQRKHHHVNTLCRVLMASRSGFYRWLKSHLSNRKKRDIQLKKEILRIHAEFKQIYGSPRIHASLLRISERCGKKRVARLMRELGIRSIIKKKHKVTTNSQHRRPVAPNLLNRQFNPNRLNKAWASDITYIRTNEGWLYLAVIMDLFSRKIVGWATSDRINDKLIKQALIKAIRVRKPKPGLLFHSDQGKQYASEEIQSCMDRAKITCSMSNKGDCYDNAVVESFFDSLKSEWTFHKRYQTREEAGNSLFEYIEFFYNRRRLHSSIGYLSPMEYEAISVN
jgi:putative transposase